MPDNPTPPLRPHNVASLDAINIIDLFDQGKFEEAGEITDLYYSKDKAADLMWSLSNNASLLLRLLDMHGLRDFALAHLRKMYLSDEFNADDDT